MKMLFIGGTKRGFLTLLALINNGAQFAGIISLQQDPHEVERYEGSIRTLADKYHIPCYETKWMKDRNFTEIISGEIRPDIALVVGCRILIPVEIYQIPPLGTLAVHDSLLPNYRGFAPVNWSILNGEDHTGVTLFYLNEFIDGGHIVAQKRVPIGPDDTAPMVYERVCQATVDVVLEAYPLIVRKKAPYNKQDSAAGSFTCSRGPMDGMIDWNSSTTAIYNQIRGLTHPYPGAFTVYSGNKLIIWEAKPVVNPQRYVGRIPGRVVAVSKTEGHVDVLTCDGILRISAVQLEGKTRTAAASVIKSVRATLGLQTMDLHNRIKVLEQQVAKLAGDRS